MWFSLRVGLANTAVIAALAMLPLVSAAASLMKSGPEPVRLDPDFAMASRVAWQADPLLDQLAD